VIPITRRMTLLVTTAALVPLVVFGIVAWLTVQSVTRSTVIENNRALVQRGAEAVTLFLNGSFNLMRAAGADLQGTGLQQWQQNRVLSNYVLDLPEFRELALFDRRGALVASSLPDGTSLRPLMDTAPGELAILPVEVDDDLLPRTQVTLGLRDGQAAYLVAELRLETIWRIVDGIRVGQRGRAVLVERTGRLIADGTDNGMARVARGDELTGHPLLGEDAPPPSEDIYDAGDGTERLAVSSVVEPVRWRLLLEQPTDEAFAASRRLSTTLLLFVALALLGNIAIGIAFGRSLLRPISDLLTGIDAIGRGRLDERVRITRDDEFRQLGDAFNAMADRLGSLQQAAIRQERQAMFGRIAAGLVHDLSHPIQNINNNCKLIVQMYDDAEYRQNFARLVKREFGTIQRTFEDLRNLARPIPLERFPVDAVKLAHDVVDRMSTQASVAGVTLEAIAPPGATYQLEGDLFALLRVLRNLVLNALQATPPGGRVTVEVDGDGDGDGRHVLVHVRDTGCGIPADRLEAIFEDFVTTKRRGLGLGLAISKKTVEEMGGALRVESVVGEGTHFVVELPRSMPTESVTAH
jgi:signal transduction histidine kinase